MCYAGIDWADRHVRCGTERNISTMDQRWREMLEVTGLTLRRKAAGTIACPESGGRRKRCSLVLRKTCRYGESSTASSPDTRGPIGDQPERTLDTVSGRTQIVMCWL
jgi:hypothetical protein